MSKISDAMERSRSEQDRPRVGEVSRFGEVPLVVGASRTGLPEGDVESYQALGSEIYLSLPDVSSRVIMFVSADPEAGTSTVAREFAMTMAVNGEVVTAIVDANLRKPVLHDAFGVQRAPGVSDHVLSGAELADCVKGVGVPHLSLLPAGRPSVAPPRILADPATGRMLGGLRADHELVVVDSAPLLPFSEGLPLSQNVDGVVVVVRSAETKQGSIQRLLALLDDAGANVLGSVLNVRKHYIPRFIYDRL